MFPSGSVVSLLACLDIHPAYIILPHQTYSPRLDLALTAAWTIIDSKAMPVLLEGILLLGGSVSVDLMG